MKNRMPGLGRSLVPLLALLSACSTATPANSASESAAASPGPSSRAPLVPPDTMLSTESVRRTPSSVPLPAADTVAGERATIARLEREARAIAKTTGCNSSSACRSAPVGAKACGGPRTYIVYCATSTDTVALMRKLKELERVERAYNERSGMMSTCEMRLPPTVSLVGGSCREGPPGP